VLILDSHDTTSPGSSEVNVVVELCGEHFGEGFEVLEVFFVDFGESEAGGGLLVDKFTEVSLTSEEAEWDTLLSAESGEEADHFNWVNIVSDDNHLGGAFFNKGGNVVETVLDDEGLGSDLLVLLSSEGFESLLFGGSSLGAVLSEQFEEFAGLVSFEGALELGNGRRDLKSLHENSLLTLNSNVLGPLDESGEISDGLDVSSNSEVSGVLLEKSVLFA
jgi:hypothetical protein